MSLESLNFDRFLFRNKNGSSNTPAQGIASGVPDGASYDTGDEMSGGGLSGDTGGISGQPGGIIAQMYLRSSNGPDRVEINPNDSFIAYNADSPVVTIDKNGISIGTATLPQVYAGAVFNTGSAIYLPPGWSCVRNGLGDYTITHNLNAPTWYSVVVSPITGHYRGKIASLTVNSVNITFQESVYAAGLYTGETLVDTDFNFIIANVV